MKQNYLAILLHPAKAAPGVSGTGSSLASPLLAPQWGSRVILFPSTVKTAIAFQTVRRQSCYLLPTLQKHEQQPVSYRWDISQITKSVNEAST